MFTTNNFDCLKKKPEMLRPFPGKYDRSINFKTMLTLYCLTQSNQSYETNSLPQLFLVKKRKGFAKNSVNYEVDSFFITCFHAKRIC